MFFNWLCIVLGFATILYSFLYLARKSNIAMVGLGIATGFLLLAFGNLDKFKSINAVGFEATLHEALATTDSSISRLEQSVEPLISESILSEKKSVAGSARFVKLVNAYFDLEFVDPEVEEHIRPLIIEESRRRVHSLQKKYALSRDSVGTQRNGQQVFDLNTVIASLPDSIRNKPEVQDINAFYVRHNLPLDGGVVAFILESVSK